MAINKKLIRILSPLFYLSRPIFTDFKSVAEHCNRIHGALRLSAPLRTFSPSAGSMPPGALPAKSDQDRLLVTAFHSPVTVAPFRSLHSGVKVPGLLLRSPTARPRCPFGLLAPPRVWFAPDGGGFTASIPLQRLRAVRPAAPAVSTPLQDF
jgi:hypothetical protein